jgi:hypothetical protein
MCEDKNMVIIEHLNPFDGSKVKTVGEVVLMDGEDYATVLFRDENGGDIVRFGKIVKYLIGV